MFCRKNAVIFFLCLLFILWGYLTYDVNRRFPNPENIKAEQNETVDYKGIHMSAKDMEIYQYDQLMERYPQLEQVYDLMEAEDEKNDMYFIVPIAIENRTGNVWEQGKQSIVTWVLEVGEESNGVDYFCFLEMNPDYHTTLQPGESQNIIIPFSISKDYLTPEEAVSEDKKIVYSYYPTKNYLFYPGE